MLSTKFLNSSNASLWYSKIGSSPLYPFNVTDSFSKSMFCRWSLHALSILNSATYLNVRSNLSPIFTIDSSMILYTAASSTPAISFSPSIPTRSTAPSKFGKNWTLLEKITPPPLQISPHNVRNCFLAVLLQQVAQPLPAP